MDDNDRRTGPAEDLTPEERDFFARRLMPPEGPSLPASLTAEALFRRLDAGALTLPEDETAGPPAEAPAEPPPAETGRVIPWQRVLRRWLPIAACLAVVLLLYRNRQTAMARNFAGAGLSSAAPEAVSYAMEEDTADGEGEAPAENAPAPAAAAAPPAPEPESSPAEAAAPQSGSSFRQNDTSRNGELSRESTTADADTTEDAGTSEAASAPSTGGPPTGGSGEDANPDTGSCKNSGQENANPDVGYGEPEDIPPRTLAIYAEMELLAQANAPAGCTFTIPYYAWEAEEGNITFLVRYEDPDGGEAGGLLFACLLREEEKDGRPLWLEVLSCEEAG